MIFVCLILVCCLILGHSQIDSSTISDTMGWPIKYSLEYAYISDLQPKQFGIDMTSQQKPQKSEPHKLSFSKTYDKCQIKSEINLQTNQNTIMITPTDRYTELNALLLKISFKDNIAQHFQDGQQNLSAILFINHPDIYTMCLNQSANIDYQSIESSITAEYLLSSTSIEIYLIKKQTSLFQARFMGDENSTQVKLNRNEQISNYCAWILLAVSSFAILLEIIVIVRQFLQRTRKNQNSSIYDSDTLSKHSVQSRDSNNSRASNRNSNDYQRMR